MMYQLQIDFSLFLCVMLIWIYDQCIGMSSLFDLLRLYKCSWNLHWMYDWSYLIWRNMVAHWVQYISMIASQRFYQYRIGNTRYEFYIHIHSDQYATKVQDSIRIWMKLHRNEGHPTAYGILLQVNGRLCAGVATLSKSRSGCCLICLFCLYTFVLTVKLFLKGAFRVSLQ